MSLMIGPDPARRREAAVAVIPGEEWVAEKPVRPIAAAGLGAGAKGLSGV